METINTSQSNPNKINFGNKWVSYFRNKIAPILFGGFVFLSPVVGYAKNNYSPYIKGPVSSITYHQYKEGKEASGYMQIGRHFCNYFQVTQQGENSAIANNHCINGTTDKRVGYTVKAQKDGSSIMELEVEKIDLNYSLGLPHGVNIILHAFPIKELSPLGIGDFKDYNPRTYRQSHVVTVKGLVPDKSFKAGQFVNIRGYAYKVKSSVDQIYLILSPKEVSILKRSLGKLFGGLSSAPVFDENGKILGAVSITNDRYIFIDLIPRKINYNGQVSIDFSRIPHGKSR